jgi:hypothetical protein
MAEIVGRIEPEVMRQRMEQTLQADPKFVEYVREENARAKALRKAALRKQAKAMHDRKEAEKRVLSGKFNNVRIKER